MPAILAHAGVPIAPHDLWSAWSLQWTVLGPLVAVAFAYGHTVRGLWRSGGRGAGISERQVAWFAAGVVSLAVALVSPLDALGVSLFSAHMAQHLLLTLVAAPLLLLGRVHLGLWPVLPLAVRRRAARLLGPRLRGAPVAVTVGVVGLHVAALLAWHLPVLYDAAVRVEVLHAAEHVTLLGTAMAFWAVMGAARARPAAAAGLAAFVVSLASVLLAATMTAASHPWYASHLPTTAAWGLSPLHDQYLAAAMMWVVGGVVYLGAAAATIVQWIRADERRLARQRSRMHPAG